MFVFRLYLYLMFQVHTFKKNKTENFKNLLNYLLMTISVKIKNTFENNFTFIF